jgi:predicted ATPase/DNA-binding winged helix-turn-helix (wHTH) protein
MTGGPLSGAASFGPFRLSPAGRVIERDGVPLELGDRALDLLIVLVEHAGEVVSHRELIAQVWRDLVVSPGNLRVHMSALRKALGDGEGGARYIENVTGQGYCFVAPVKRTGNAVTAARIRSSQPAATIAQARALPPALTRMVGRDDTVRTIAADLRSDRFVTIVGPGGMGKTTVAVSVAHAMLEEFDGKVCFVDLAGIADPALLATMVASTLDLSIQSADAFAILMASLQGTRMLLVLDNCEHVIDAAASLAEAVFLHAPHVHILATSREALRVEGEHAHWLRPLESPPQNARVSAATALQYPAIKLFVQRAIASDSRFELTDANAPIVADICGRLDGIALALEFVAGRVGTYGLEGTADLLNKRLGLHWPGRRTALPRHQTLHALLDWSYGLLAQPEQRALRRLSIFVGPFSLAGARAVALDAELDEIQLTNALDQLIAKSLVSSMRTQEGETRYRLLETTRIFAIQKHEESGERDATARRHARYFIQESNHTAAGRFRKATGHEHLGNLRAGLEWCFGGPENDTCRDTELGLDLAVASAPVFLELSLWNECLTWSKAALASLPISARGDRRELVLREAFAVSSMFTGGDDVRASMVRALELARQLGETAIRLRLLASLHFYSHRIADFKSSLGVSEEIEAVARTTEDVTYWAIADWLQGSSHYVLGNQMAAEQLFEKGFSYGDQHVAEAQHLGIYYRSRGLNGLARVRWLCGYPDRALQAARQAVEESVDTTPVNQSYALLLACHVFVWCGDLRTAQEIIDKVLSQPHWQGRLVWFHTEALALKGELLVRRGNVEQGIELLRAALNEMKKKRSVNLMLTVTASALAEALATEGRLDEALSVIDEVVVPVPIGDETWETPELLRVKAGILLAMPQPDIATAEGCLERSLTCARAQHAKGWELRATITLATLRSMQGRHQEAHRLLSAIYEQFTEGFDTQDLKDAHQLLSELANRGTGPAGARAD